MLTALRLVRVGPAQPRGHALISPTLLLQRCQLHGACQASLPQRGQPFHFLNPPVHGLHTTRYLTTAFQISKIALDDAGESVETTNAVKKKSSKPKTVRTTPEAIAKGKKLKEEKRLIAKQKNLEEKQKKAEEKEITRLNALQKKLEEKQEKTEEKEKAKASVRLVLKRPPQPTNRFGLFVQQQTSNHPKKVFKDIKDDFWALSDVERAALQDQAERMRADYLIEYNEWLKSLTPAMIKEDLRVRKNRKSAGRKSNIMLYKIRLPGQPKAPPSIFIDWTNRLSSEEKERIYGGVTKFTERSKALAAAWKDVPEEQKDVLTRRFSQRSQEYKIAKAEFAAQFEAPKVEASVGEGSATV